MHDPARAVSVDPPPKRQDWEYVGGGLCRFPVPGGWIYSNQPAGTPGAAICFVPAPPATSLLCPPYGPAVAGGPRWPARD